MTAQNLIAILALQLALILLNAFFAAAEIAVLQLNPAKLRHMAEEGDKHAPRILKLVESPTGFLSAIQIGITLAGLLASAFAADNFADPMAGWLVRSFSLSQAAHPIMRTASIVVITIILSFFTLVLGELVPKQLALHKPYPVARYTAGPVSALAVLMKPAIWLLSASSRLVLRLFGIQGERREVAITEDEIRMMMDAGSENGSIEEEEKQMIENVFDLRDTLARDVMTHRVDVVAIEADASPAEVLAIIRGSGMSRFPVYDNSYDDILGVLSARIYLMSMQDKEPPKVRELLRPAHFVPETVKADILLRDMQGRQDHMALVLDEYGGFSGLVTMEDIIEEIVGSIYDEFDEPDEPEISQMEENLWRITGDTDIEDIEDELGVKLPDDREYDSLGGLVFSQLNAIPDDGERVTMDAEGLHIETGPIEDHHVPWALVSLLPLETEGEEDEKAKKRGKDE